MPPSTPHTYGEEFEMLSLWCNTSFFLRSTGIVYLDGKCNINEKNTVGIFCATVINCIIIYFASI